MSKYTIEVRFICEQAAGLKDSVGFNGVETVIAKAAPKIFDFYYPIFDDNYRRALEEKILLHYYTREICEETIGLWKLRLKARLNEIMPYYNQLYESTLLKFNPFTDIDYTLTHKGRANESKKQESNTERREGTDYSEGTKTVSTTDIDENINSNEIENTNTVSAKTGNEKAIETNNTDTTENSNTTNDTTDNSNTTENNVLNKTVDTFKTINDTEKTVTADTENSKTTTGKITNEDKTEIKTGINTDTENINETTERTPNLHTVEKTDNLTKDYGTGFDARNIQRSEDTVTAQNETTHETANGTKNYSDNSLDLYSDTPQGNLAETTIDNGTPNGVTDGLTLSERIDSRYLTNVRDISAVHNETNTQEINKNGNLNNTKNFDETTDDNATYTRNYHNDLDGTKVTDQTGKETTQKTGHNVTTHNINEQITNDNKITENTNTEFTDTKNGTKDFNKDENTSINEQTAQTENKNKIENKTIHSVTDFEKTVNEQENKNKNVDSIVDFNENINATDDYNRDKTSNMKYDGNKDTLSRKELLENIYDGIQHNIRNTDEYINHAVGKISDISMSKMLLEYRETFINIDEMIIEELSDLFFLLY